MSDGERIMNNKMEQVAQMLEVEIGEMFRIEGSNVLHRLSEQGGEWFDDNTQRWSVDGCILNYLLVDGMKIIKQPWKPKHLDEFWYIRTNGTIGSYRWCDAEVDNLLFKLGNMYKTEEEASKNVTRYLKFLETANSWRTENNETNDSEVGR